MFYSMKGIRVLAERWLVHYNTIRSHSSLGYQPPVPQAWTPSSLEFGEAEIAGLIPSPQTATFRPEP